MPRSQHYSSSPERIVGRYTAINGGTKPPNFLQKLYDFLSLDPHPCPDVIYWASDSKQLVIAQPDKLAKEVLPKLFKHDKIASFGRQLNIYGFSRLFPGRQFKDSNGNISDASVWAHPTLNRLSTPSELLSIKRRAPPKLIRTRRLANGEIIKTKAGPGVIEKARKIKESMLLSKSREREKSSSAPNWNLSKSQDSNSVQSQLCNDDNFNNLPVNSSGDHKPIIKPIEMKRNSTLLSDITEYPENDKDNEIEDQTNMNNSVNTNISSSTNSYLSYIPNSASTTTTLSTAPSVSNWPHPTPGIVSNISNTKSGKGIASSLSTSPKNPFMILGGNNGGSGGERLYSSCPASIHNSPSMKHLSTPLTSSWSANSNNFGNTLTSNLFGHNANSLGHGYGPMKPNLKIDTNAHHQITFPNSLKTSYSYNFSGPSTPSLDEQQLPQIQSQIPQPTRIAAPAAPIPPHLIQAQGPQAIPKPSYMFSSIGPEGIQMYENNDGNQPSYGYDGEPPKPPHNMVLSTPTLPPLTINTAPLPLKPHPSYMDHTGAGGPLMSSWDKQNPAPGSGSWSKSFYTPLSGNSGIVRPMIIGNGNGTIDPRWISPVGSEWSTPSVTRLPSPAPLQVALQSGVQTPNPTHQYKVDPSREEAGEDPQYIWYNPPSHLSTLNSSSDSNGTDIMMNCDTKPNIQLMENANNIDQPVNMTNNFGYPTGISHSFESTLTPSPHQGSSMGSEGSYQSHVNQVYPTGNAHELNIDHARFDKPVNSIDNKPFMSSPLAPLSALPRPSDDNLNIKDNSTYSTPVNGMKWFE